ncbi:YdcF family protein [Actinomyces gaoshouyii]|uniref:YdcF family protein n=1 Tax=Actinomyces gaoshouyii TaxID=1960083 RepID=UPI0013DE33DB|nr:YdcF family protein [Actinomyces gaoshouyii]
MGDQWRRHVLAAVRALRRLDGHGAGHRRIVVVLGHADAGPSAGGANRRRARAAVAALRPGDLLICSGGAVVGERPEAEMLAEHARGLGWRGATWTETASRSTWENIGALPPLIEAAGGDGPIILVSDPLHAAKAGLIARRRFPALARRLAPMPPRVAALARPGPVRTVLAAADLALTSALPAWAPRSATGAAGIRALPGAVAGQWRCRRPCQLPRRRESGAAMERGRQGRQ